MRTSIQSLRLYMAILFTVAALLSLAGAQPAERPAPRTTGSTASMIVPDLSGSWTGTWHDTVYDVQGDVMMEVAIDGTNWSANGTIDLSDIFWPGIGVMTGTATGTLSGNTLTFSFTAADVGTGNGTLVDGSGSGDGSVTAPMNFGAYTFTGTVTGTEINGTFDFTSPTGGGGDVILTRAVANEEASWSAFKAAWR